MLKNLFTFLAFTLLGTISHAQLVNSTSTSSSSICAGDTVLIQTNAFIDSSNYSFNLTVRTTNPGISDSNQFQLTGALGQYNIISTHINTGSIETFNNLVDQQTLTFSNGPGDYLIEIYPQGTTPFHRIRFNNGGDKSKLIDVSQWGNIEWSTFASAFRGCDSFNISAVDAPDMALVTNMDKMFFGATKLNCDLNNWDVSNVEIMSSVFERANIFNGNISSWNMSSTEDISGMFRFASNFNSYIGDWDVSKVTDMSQTFRSASNFNQDIGNWDVSSVISMGATFKYAVSFNQDIGDWDVSNVIGMAQMFRLAYDFNQDIGNWDVSNVFSFYEMFRQATTFNQDLGNWDVSGAYNMGLMFHSAFAFNQDLTGWCVSNISSEPFSFTNVSTFVVYNHPVWGTCP